MQQRSRACIQRISAALSKRWHSATCTHHHHPASFSSKSSSSSSRRPIQCSVAPAAQEPFIVKQLTLRPPAADEVLVKVVATEGVGIVEEVGSSISTVRAGDHVLMSYASCASCPSCHSGLPSYCVQHGSLNFGGGLGGLSGLRDEKGEVAGAFFRQSSFATYALCTLNNIVPVPSSLPLAPLAPLGCGIQTGAGAIWNALQPKENQSLAVFGAGAVGIAALLAARIHNLKHLIAIDRNPAKLSIAKQLCATHILQTSGKETQQELKEKLLSIVGEVDFALDTTGVPSVLRGAVEMLKPNGTCGLIGGASPGVTVQLEMLHLLMGRRVRGIIQGDSVPQILVPKMIDLWQRGVFPYDKIITYYDGLESINQAVEDCKDVNGSVIKPVIRLVKQ